MTRLSLFFSIKFQKTKFTFLQIRVYCPVTYKCLHSQTYLQNINDFWVEFAKITFPVIMPQSFPSTSYKLFEPV